MCVDKIRGCVSIRIVVFGKRRRRRIRGSPEEGKNELNPIKHPFVGTMCEPPWHAALESAG